MYLKSVNKVSAHKLEVEILRIRALEFLEEAKIALERGSYDTREDAEDMVKLAKETIDLVNKVVGGKT